MNEKYRLKIEQSNLDYSNLASNSWFTGFSEADGHFGVKIVEAKPKSETRKRSVSANISLRFRLDQRSFDKPNNSSMEACMESLACFLNCQVGAKRYKTSLVSRTIQRSPNEMLSVSVQSINNLAILVKYFNKFPLLGTKGKDFKCWEKVYFIILSKQHLQQKGKLEIKSIVNEMKLNKK